MNIVLVGIGGYGEVYLEALLDPANAEPGLPAGHIVGAVDPNPGACRRVRDLKERGVPFYTSLEEFYGVGRADLAVISSPIQFHREQTCLALEKGSYVLCEKPAAATVDDVDAMIACERRSGRWVAIGYQWSFSASIQELKRDIQAGHFGTPRRMKSLTLWPRDASYYKRNNWAGRLRDDRGRWVMDSPLNNAMAHDMHNMLYLLGDEMARSAMPAAVTAELYRANEIESFDTAALRVETESGAELRFYASHAVAEIQDPIFLCEFSDAEIEFAGGMSPIRVQFRDGRLKEYPSPNTDPQWKKLWTCLKGNVDPSLIPCGLKAARSQTLCVGAAAESMPVIAAFPDHLIRRSGPPEKESTWVDGLAEILRNAYQAGLLPGEMDVVWARTGRRVLTP
ncbi:MAG: Gfo/Idh/MocA family oxidoreductase [Candidatus Eisenbacteria bacterium]|uniref:Gfo/Idh/MocA family oxidoreductase n=1 Tax=Eiseniibacteriota bacterium TaxID=2212470 RepID=A0A948W7A9_UNCEI|nr:Gfo/Idh/MocA family oxidoreductase [Candidatus Eisenbacteria bacterium]MBU1947721.1 Gfo/Idh/MocA family oxidoreductase [Candidatus Eisenbacteria bacterium]MBU2692035.1 Gfo/Idh/MocA family oxidoreductase [Candidatus Eisenbacteria bacterium]